MKKRILASSLITVIFALLIVTCSFIALVNIKEIDKTKEILSVYNNLVIKSNSFKDGNLDDFKISNAKVRFTFVDRDGNVLKDSNENLENHLNRDEIVEALKNGEASSTRYSETQATNVIYYATKIDDNTLVRSSVPLYTIKVFSESYITYYFIVIVFVILLSLGLSLKLIRAIIYPVKELEIATNKIANGDYSRRVSIYTNDEIGSLANTFNNMADQLQSRISDSLDKQNKLEAILESMESGVIAVDNKQKVMLINPYAKNLFGIKEDIIGENISEYIIDYDILSFMRNIPAIEMKEIKLIHPILRELRIKKAPIINDKNTSPTVAPLIFSIYKTTINIKAKPVKIIEPNAPSTDFLGLISVNPFLKNFLPIATPTIPAAVSDIQTKTCKTKGNIAPIK